MQSTVRRVIYLFVLAAVASYAFVHLQGPQGLPALFAKRAEVAQLEKDTRKLQEEVEALEKQNEALKHKPEVLEPYIHRDMEMVPENTQVFREQPEPNQDKGKPARKAPAAVE